MHACIGLPLSLSFVIVILVCVFMYSSGINKHLSLNLLSDMGPFTSHGHHILERCGFIEESLVSENVYLILPPHTHIHT